MEIENFIHKQVCIKGCMCMDEQLTMYMHGLVHSPLQCSQSTSGGGAGQQWDPWSVRGSPATHHPRGRRTEGRPLALSPDAR